MSYHFAAYRTAAHRKSSALRHDGLTAMQINDSIRSFGSTWNIPACHAFPLAAASFAARLFQHVSAHLHRPGICRQLESGSYHIVSYQLPLCSRSQAARTRHSPGEMPAGVFICKPALSRVFCSGQREADTARTVTCRISLPSRAAARW